VTVNGPGTRTLTEPINVGGSGANNGPSSGTGSTTAVSSGSVIGTQTDSVIMPVTSIRVTASTGTEPVSGPVGSSSI
jgi:hypothetical protein